MRSAMHQYLAAKDCRLSNESSRGAVHCAPHPCTLRAFSCFPRQHLVPATAESKIVGRIDDAVAVKVEERLVSGGGGGLVEPHAKQSADLMDSWKAPSDNELGEA